MAFVLVRICHCHLDLSLEPVVSVTEKQTAPAWLCRPSNAARSFINFHLDPWTH